MVERKKNLLSLCQRLSAENPTLIFWKHLARGLSGCGDIDAIAPPAVAEVVRGSFARHAEAIFGDVGAVFSCRHADNTYPIFLLSPSTFPRLLQFDVSYQPVRFGLPWCDPAKLGQFSKLNEEGIRTLQPGPLAVVLLMLYGLNRTGEMRLKSHDLADVERGLATDVVNALHFVTIILPPALQKSMIVMLKSFESTGIWWNRALVKSVWEACLWAALRYNMTSGWRHMYTLLRRRCSRFCDIQLIVHRHGRVVQHPDIASFMRTVRATEHVLLDRTG